jgi:hypothetical protein
MKWYISLVDEGNVGVLVDDTGKVILEQKVPTEPADIIALLTPLGVTLSRIGIEAGPLSLPLAGRRVEEYPRSYGAAAPRSRGSCMDVAAWLRGPGLEQYKPAIPRYAIDGSVSPVPYMIGGADSGPVLCHYGQRLLLLRQISGKLYARQLRSQRLRRLIGLSDEGIP